ncbi:MAG: lysophospholipid acyltransferase family protein [Ignavibacteriaceae bacterium]|nr:lysophospholipid acyltransferase family protein [Ignavibacteriaceae bacterium]
MIKADHKKWARILFDFYIERQFKRSFSSFNLINPPPEIPEGTSVLFTPNHFSWWDGFLIDLICKKLYPSKIFHILMLEEQLKRYYFFNYLGAYSINLNDARSMIESINYTNNLLNKPDNFIAFYPQGEIQLYGLENIKLKKGFKRVLGASNANYLVVPVAFKFQFEEEKLPAIYCRFGEIIKPANISGDYKLFEDSFMFNIQMLEKFSTEKKRFDTLF